MRAEKLIEKLKEFSAAHAQSGSGYGEHHALREDLSRAVAALRDYDQWHKTRHGCAPRALAQ